MKRIAVALALICALLGADSGPTDAANEKVTGNVIVLADSSLTDAFNVIAKQFEQKYFGTHVTLRFESSTTLASQIEFRVPADVFAPGDKQIMDGIADLGRVNPGARVFARNRLEIAVAPRNPKRIRSLADTLRNGVKLAVCAFAEPCGKLAREAYGRAGLTIPNLSTGTHAKDTLSRVTAGTADAAVVYVSDVKAAARQVDGVPIPRDQNVVGRYPIAPIIGTKNPVAARAFVLFVRSNAGQRILRRFGFLKP
jgi:molybdate transport system substrate-binding protein